MVEEGRDLLEALSMEELTGTELNPQRARIESPHTDLS